MAQLVRLTCTLTPLIQVIIHLDDWRCVCFVFLIFALVGWWFFGWFGF